MTRRLSGCSRVRPSSNLEKGDKSNIFFPPMCQLYEYLNTIWEMKREEGEVVRSFNDLKYLGVKYFEAI